MKWKEYLINNSIYLAIAVLLSLTTACQKQDEPQTGSTPKLSPAQVTVAHVKRHDAENQIEIVGTVQAVDRAEISSKITGNILELPVKLGSHIKQGELLVVISAGEISARVQQARAQLDQALRNLAREQKLLKKNAATPETVKSLQDTVWIAEASHKEAKTMLNYTKVLAPFDGIVTRKIANAGDLATPGKPLLQIEAGDKLEILTDIPEAVIQSISQGTRLSVHIPAVNTRVEGEVTEISPVSDPSSRTTPIKIHIQSQPQLRSGQFARVCLKSEGIESFVIPASAVTMYGQIERVFVNNQGFAALRLVRTGATVILDSGESYMEILSGLDEDDIVITTGNHNLEHGQPLEIIELPSSNN
jgi:RND family efflux transporter MFP subunit